MNQPQKMSPARTEFLEQRRKGIGGSDAAGIMGISPWTNPRKIYEEKRGLTIPDDPENNPHLKWGLILEGPIIKEFMDQTGVTVKTGLPTLTHPKYSFMRASLDGMIVGASAPTKIEPKGIIEAKSSHSLNQSKWGDEWSDEIPEYYILQCQHNMEVSGEDICYVPVLLGASDFRIYQVERNKRIIDTLIEAEGAFWERVQSGDAPEIDGSEASKELLKNLYPEDTGEVIEPDEIVVEYLKLIYQAKEEMKIAEEDKRKYENLVKDFMKDASIMPVPDLIKGKGVQWKRTKDAIKVDWKGVALEVIDILIDEGIVTAEYRENIINQFGERKSGYRRFLCNFKEI